MNGTKGLTATSKSEESISSSIFGRPPILRGENAESYDALLARVTNAVNPQDVIEEIWIHDVVELSWEVFRWRRLVRDLVERWELSLNEIAHIERVDRLAMTAEARRNSALREIERHRISFAQRLRSSISEMQPADFKVVKHEDVATRAEGQT